MSYVTEWERYYNHDLLVLWGLLGYELRNRTTPAKFRQWVYEHSREVEPIIVPEPEDRDDDYLNDPVLLADSEQAYVRMYHYCEQAYLPLLHYHSEALASLQDLCLLREDDNSSDTCDKIDCLT